MTKKAYPLRINAQILDALQQWASDELRSVNSQIEYLLRDALRKAGRTEKLIINPIFIEDDEETDKEQPEDTRWID